MTNIIKKTCDACGRKFEESLRNMTVLHLSEMEGNVNRSNMYMLCPECLESFKEWVRARQELVNEPEGEKVDGGLQQE